MGCWRNFELLSVGTRLRSSHCRIFNYLKLCRPAYFIRSTRVILQRRNQGCGSRHIFFKQKVHIINILILYHNFALKMVKEQFDIRGFLNPDDQTGSWSDLSLPSESVTLNVTNDYFRFLATVSSVISFYLLIQLFQTPVFNIFFNGFSYNWLCPSLVFQTENLQQKKIYNIHHGTLIRWYCKTPCAQMYPPSWNPSMSENSCGRSNDR